MQTLPFECHNVSYQCQGLDQSNIVCEYEGYNWKTMLNIKVICPYQKGKFAAETLNVKVTMLHFGEKVLA